MPQAKPPFNVMCERVMQVSRRSILISTIACAFAGASEALDRSIANLARSL
jgi:hypothetical protein